MKTKTLCLHGSQQPEPTNDILTKPTTLLKITHERGDLAAVSNTSTIFSAL